MLERGGELADFTKCLCVCTVHLPLPQEDPPIQRPKRLLDLWANRWLYPEELEGAQNVK